MSLMNQSLLTPNPEDWLSGLAAAELIGVSYAQFYRYINGNPATGEHPRIKRYTMQGSDRPMFWRAEIQRFADARRLATGGARADR
jgi:hypothetical protein